MLLIVMLENRIAYTAQALFTQHPKLPMEAGIRFSLGDSALVTLSRPFTLAECEATTV